MSVYSFITQPFRYAERFDTGVRDSYALARTVQIDGSYTNLSNANTMAQILFDILKSPRQRFDVVVHGVNVVNLSMYDGYAPCAVLVHDRFDLSGGKAVIIPEFSIDLGAGQTTLRCWG